MGEKYLSFLQDEAVQCEQKQQWEACIEHSDSFIKAYAGSELAHKAELLKKQLEDKRDYLQLRKTASKSAADFQKAYKSYQTYLADHPDSIQRGEIEKEMARLGRQIKDQEKWLAVRAFATDASHGLFERIQKLDRYLKKNISGDFAGEAQSLLERLEQERQGSLRSSQLQAEIQSEKARMQRLQQEQTRRQERVRQLQAELETRLKGSARFHSNGNGTFKDLSTGLTWSTLDSYQELGGCVTYEAGLKYVQGLQHGGVSAWRLPTANELATLYKQAPYFPESGAQWYWSIETAVKGYHSVAEVVTAEHESVFKRSQRELTECGSVRAVLATQ